MSRGYGSSLLRLCDQGGHSRVVAGALEDDTVLELAWIFRGGGFECEPVMKLMVQMGLEDLYLFGH